MDVSMNISGKYFCPPCTNPVQTETISV